MLQPTHTLWPAGLGSTRNDPHSGACKHTQGVVHEVDFEMRLTLR